MKTTFKESYCVLQRHAQTLRTQTEPNIDDLLSIVEESVAAWHSVDNVNNCLENSHLFTEHLRICALNTPHSLTSKQLLTKIRPYNRSRSDKPNAF